MHGLALSWVYVLLDVKDTLRFEAAPKVLNRSCIQRQTSKMAVLRCDPPPLLLTWRTAACCSQAVVDLHSSSAAAPAERDMHPFHTLVHAPSWTPPLALVSSNYESTRWRATAASSMGHERNPSDALEGTRNRGLWVPSSAE
jgi:hypothetical protein